MNVSNEIKLKYLEFFMRSIVGFKRISSSDSFKELDDKYLAIAMDKVGRLARSYGRLRERVWSNCIFYFHDSQFDPKKHYKEFSEKTKETMPYLFIRSYVYFVFINLGGADRDSLFGKRTDIKTVDYKIWVYNTKYELVSESRRSNLFNIVLKEKESVDDFIYLAKPKLELARIEDSNSDIVDFIKAFTGDLVQFEQTAEMLEKVEDKLKNKSKVRILVKGPARSGKTIIAASLLGKFPESKLLLMNYYFYNEIVDGLHALSSFTKEEIDRLVRNPKLDSLLRLRKTYAKYLNHIVRNLSYVIKEYDGITNNTRNLLLKNIDYLIELSKDCGFDYKDDLLLFRLKRLSNEILSSKDATSIKSIKLDKIVSLKNYIQEVIDKKNDKLVQYQEIIVEAINQVIRKSEQKFFHHNINKSISNKVSEGCWITRGNPTESKMWNRTDKLSLLIVDEVQRLGVVSKYKNNFVEYDRFDEIEEVLKSSKNSFFTGDDNQMLNSKYDQGFQALESKLKNNDEIFVKHSLPESVGVPDEIGMLIKYLTDVTLVDFDELVRHWQTTRDFKITFINNNQDLLVKMFDEDSCNKKHFASPSDFSWTQDKASISTIHRKDDIIPLEDHEIAKFAYKYPYFCNEEIMPYYILSAYELISREVQSLYVHLPSYEKEVFLENEWYKKHLYVLYTRPTLKLVINVTNPLELREYKKVYRKLQNAKAKVKIDFV